MTNKKKKNDHKVHQQQGHQQPPEAAAAAVAVVHADPLDDFDVTDFQTCVENGNESRSSSSQPHMEAEPEGEGSQDQPSQSQVADESGGPPTGANSMNDFTMVNEEDGVLHQTPTTQPLPPPNSTDDKNSKQIAPTLVPNPAEGRRVDEGVNSPKQSLPRTTTGGRQEMLPHPGSIASNLSGGAVSSGSFTAITPTTPYSPMAHTTQQSRGQIQDLVIAIHVQSAQPGAELVKPLTYFQLDVTITQIPIYHTQNNAAAAAGGMANREIPTTASDMNPWKSLKPSEEKRRYSEIVELRKYLSYFFPWLIIPPLPAKSTQETMSTFMGDPDSLSRQQVNLQRFVDEVRCMPELLQAKVFQEFCQIPRGSTEFIGLMDRLRANNRKLDAEYGVSDGNLLAGVEQATKAVKSLATTVTGWFAGTANHAGGSSSSPHSRNRIPLDLDTQVKLKLEQSDQYTHWLQEQDDLVRLKTELHASLTPLVGALQAQKQTVDCYADMSAILHNYSQDLSSCNEFGSLAQHAEQASKFTRALRSVKLDQVQKDESKLVAAMEHELHWVDSAYDTCGMMMSVIRQDFQNAILNNTIPYSSRPRPAVFVPPAGVDLISKEVRLEQCVTLHGCLVETLCRFRSVHQQRLTDIFAGNARHALHYLEKEMEIYADRHLHFDLLINHPGEASSSQPRGGGAPVNANDNSRAWFLPDEDLRAEQEIEAREAALIYFTEIQEQGQLDVAVRAAGVDGGNSRFHSNKQQLDSVNSM